MTSLTGTHCCARMQVELGRGGESEAARFRSADALLTYFEKFDEYGIIVHDGGSSFVLIQFCPWCGTQLPDSKRDRWFEELGKLGIDPQGDSIPPEYESGIWYREG